MSQSAYDTAALALSGIQHYWKLTETSGTSAADSQGSTTLTWGADVSGFLTTGPDGVASVPVNNGSTTRVAINNTGFAPPATASYFWWQRYDVSANDDGMSWELANSPTFSHLVQADYNAPTPSGKFLASANYGSGVGAASAFANRQTISQWDFWCLTVDVSVTAANQVQLYKNGVAVWTNNSAVSQNGLTPATMKIGVLGRNNNGTRSLPIKAAICGFGLTNTVLSTATMTSLVGAMTGVQPIGQATETDTARTVSVSFGSKTILEPGTGDPSGYNYNSFPGFVRAPDGTTLVVAYKHSDGHVGSNGTIRVRRIDVTGAAIDVQDITPTPSVNACDVSCFRTNTNEIAVMWNESSTPGVSSISTVVAHQIVFSTDNGATWSAPTNLASQFPFPTNGAGVAGAYGIAATPAIQVPAGTVLANGSTVSSTFWLVAKYGNDDKTNIDTAASPGYVKVTKSTDNCRTWSTLATSFPASASDRDYDETSLCLLSDGRILSVSRTFYYPSGRGSTAYALYSTYSSDGGATWTTPTRTLGTGVLGAVGYGGRPDLCQLTNGTLYLRCRNMATDTSSSYPSYRTSTDLGSTWSSGRDPWDLAAERFGTIGAGQAPRGKDVYGGAIDLSDLGTVGFVQSEEVEDVANKADLYYRLLIRFGTVGRATETDTAQAITSFHAPFTVGQATETDTAQAITAVKLNTARATVALSTSSSTALALSDSL